MAIIEIQITKVQVGRVPRYVYKAVDYEGNVIKGAAEYSDISFLTGFLIENGLYPIEIADVSSVLYEKIGLSSVRPSDLSAFCSLFAALLNAGISITDGLALLEKQMGNKKFRDIINKTRMEVEKGKSLSYAMSMHDEYPSFLVSMVETGELSGRLDNVMSMMADYYEMEMKLKKKILSAMLYPVIVLVTSSATAAFYISNVLPLFIKIYGNFNSTLPVPTRILMAAVKWLDNYWYVIPFTLVALLYCGKYIKSKWGQTVFSGIVLKIPLWGSLYKKIESLRFASALSILIKSGIPILKAIYILSDMFKNKPFGKIIEDCRDEVKLGGSLSKPLKSSNLFPALMVEMICIGEETGKLDDMLHKAASFYFDEVNTEAGRLSDVIGPVVTILLGAFVCFILISVIMPAFGMYELYR